MTSSLKYVNDCPTWFGVVAILTSDGLKQSLNLAGTHKTTQQLEEETSFPGAQSTCLNFPAAFLAHDFLAFFLCSRAFEHSSSLFMVMFILILLFICSMTSRRR